MKTIVKILFIPAVVFGLTAFGMWATVLAERHPSPIAQIETSPATPLGFSQTEVSKLCSRGKPPAHATIGPRLLVDGRAIRPSKSA